jgi:hypothetical protein
MRTSTLTTTLALLLPVSVLAAPTIEQRWSSPSFWASHFGHAPSSRRDCDYALCDLSKARLPQGALPSVLVLLDYMYLTHHSSDASPTTILQIELESRLYRAWHSELHLRSLQQHSNTCSGRRNSFPLQCLLHRRQSSGPALYDPWYRYQLTSTFFLFCNVTNQHGLGWPPLFPRCDHAILQFRHADALVWDRRFQKVERYFCTTGRSDWCRWSWHGSCTMAQVDGKGWGRGKPEAERGLQGQYCWRSTTCYVSRAARKYSCRVRC